MEQLAKVRMWYGLKNVSRANSVGKRKESAAEHSWSCLMLADYFLSVMKTKIDRMKVYELLLYHDLVEIETGDNSIFDETGRKDKKEKEQQALILLKEKLPQKTYGKLVTLFIEFEASKTAEAQFAKAIDALDAVIHELDYKKDWQGWTEEFLRQKKEPLMTCFPEVHEFFEEVMEYCRKEGYFSWKNQRG